MAATGPGRRRPATTGTVDRTVQLLGVPVDLHLRTFARIDGLRRELALIAAEPDAGDVPARVVALAGEFEERVGTVIADDGERLRAAQAAGRATVDLTYRIPDEAAGALTDVLHRVASLLGELDEHCRAHGELLTTPAAPDERSYEAWVFDEPVRQLDGGAATRWGAAAPG